jgi:TolB-like protein/class 3 adenylate cyclase/Tfp pilus assembly protein PilF
MAETRKLAAILCSDVVGYSRLAGADEDRILARLRALRSDLIDPTIAVHHGRIVKRTGDGSIVEFRSVVDAVRCAIEVQNAMVERNAGVSEDRRIIFRIGIHIGDIVEESDGDLMGDGVNIAARLEGIAAPGAICMSEDAYRQVKGRLDLAVTDLGLTQLKNIAEPIHTYSLEVGNPAQAKPAPAPAPEKSAPPRLSIVVLPFVNIGGDPEQEYFVDGVTENLTTDLSCIRGAFVIARNTAFTYKGRPIDVRQIGRDLNVRYVLEGSAQRGGNRIRVNVQLVDAETGNHLWAERFDKSLTDLFEMQDEIVARLANQLGVALIAAEARRADRAPIPDSTDFYFQGMAWMNAGVTLKNVELAQRLFERALALDPNNSDAMVGSGQAEAVKGAAFLTEDRIERLAAAETKLNKALSLAPNNAWAHYWMGVVYVRANNAGRGVAEFERALALDPNLAAAHGETGKAKINLGRAEETEAHEREALRLSPRDYFTFIWMLHAGHAKQCLGADEPAVEWFHRSIESNPNLPFAHFFLAASLANIGRLADARNASRAGLLLNPTFTIHLFRTGAESDNPVYLAQRERVCEAMRNAGIPEG